LASSSSLPLSSSSSSVELQRGNGGGVWAHMPWGFKEPRSALFLKEFHELLSSSRGRSGGGGVSSGVVRGGVSDGPSSDIKSSSMRCGREGGPKFLHVLRDGRDIAFGDLRLITSVLCAAYFEGYASIIDPRSPHIARQAARTPLGKACASKGRNQVGPSTLKIYSFIIYS
jgi:hypothetical protein